MSTTPQFGDSLFISHLKNFLEGMSIDATMSAQNERDLSKKQRLSLEPIPGPIPAFRSRLSSRCLVCGHIFYHEMRLRCGRCKGHCRIMSPDELRLSARYSTDGF